MLGDACLRPTRAGRAGTLSAACCRRDLAKRPHQEPHPLLCHRQPRRRGAASVSYSRRLARRAPRAFPALRARCTCESCGQRLGWPRPHKSRTSAVQVLVLRAKRKKSGKSDECASAELNDSGRGCAGSGALNLDGPQAGRGFNAFAHAALCGAAAPTRRPRGRFCAARDV